MATPAEVKDRLIAAAMNFLEGKDDAFKGRCLTNLRSMDIAKLESTLVDLAKEAQAGVQQALEARQEVRRQRHDEATFHDIETGGPIRRSAAVKAQMDKDATTFAAAAKATRIAGITEANAALVAEALGPNYSLEAAIEWLEHSGPTMCSAPSVHDRNRWNHEDAKERQAKIQEQNEYRKNLPHEQLRAEVRAAGAQAHATQVTQEAQRQLQITETREAQSGMFQPLPKVLRDGTQVTSQYLIALSNSPHGSEGYNKFKWFCKATGFAAVTRRINGLD